MGMISTIKDIWDKTIFSDMIREKKELKAMRREIRSEAKREAIQQAKEEMKKEYIKQEIDRIKGNKSGKKRFDHNKFSAYVDKVGKNLGLDNSNIPTSAQPQSNGFFSEQKLIDLGLRPQPSQPVQNIQKPVKRVIVKKRIIAKNPVKQNSQQKVENVNNNYMNNMFSQDKIEKLTGVKKNNDENFFDKKLKEMMK